MSSFHEADSTEYAFFRHYKAVCWVNVWWEREKNSNFKKKNHLSVIFSISLLIHLRIKVQNDESTYSRFWLQLTRIKNDSLPVWNSCYQLIIIAITTKIYPLFCQLKTEAHLCYTITTFYFAWISNLTLHNLTLCNTALQVNLYLDQSSKYNFLK